MGRWPIPLVLVLALACQRDPATDAGARDAGARDAGASDAGAADSGIDAASLDAGGEDAGSACVTLRAVLPIPDGVTSLALDADSIYVGSPSALRVIALADFTAREAPVPVLQVLATGGVIAVYDGSALRVLSNDAGLEETAWVDVSGQATVAGFGDTLYAYRHPSAARINVFEAHRITDLSGLASLSTVDVTGKHPVRIATDGAVALVADVDPDADDTLTVVDVSDPTAAMPIVRMPLSPRAGHGALAVYADRGFLGTVDGVRVFDLATLDELPSMAGGEALVARGSRLLTLDSAALRVHDLDAGTTREEPALAPAYAIAWVGQVLALGDGSGVRVYDVCF
ncbi:MAG: hypothetical protein AB7S26_06140 [Sandaracinaceae bacterium]